MYSPPGVVGVAGVPGVPGVAGFAPSEAVTDAVLAVMIIAAGAGVGEVFAAATQPKVKSELRILGQKTTQKLSQFSESNTFESGYETVATIIGILYVFLVRSYN